MIHRQHNGRADRGDAGAVNAVHVEAAHPGAAQKVEEPAAGNGTNDAEQDVDDGPLAPVVLTVLLAVSPSANPPAEPR